MRRGFRASVAEGGSDPAALIAAQAAQITAGQALTAATTAQALTTDLQPDQNSRGSRKNGWSRKFWTSQTPWATAPRLLPDHTLAMEDHATDGPSPLLMLGEAIYAKGGKGINPGADYTLNAVVETFEATSVRLHAYAYTPGGTPAATNLSKTFAIAGPGIHNLVFYIRAEDFGKHTFVREGARNLATTGTTPVRVSDLALREMPQGAIRFAEQLLPSDGPDYAAALERVMEMVRLMTVLEKTVDFGGKKWATSEPVNMDVEGVTFQNGGLQWLPGPNWDGGTTHATFWDGQPVVKKGLIRQSKKRFTVRYMEFGGSNGCNMIEDINTGGLTVEHCSFEGYYNYGLRHLTGGGAYFHKISIRKGGTDILQDADVNLGVGLLLGAGEFNANRVTVHGGQWQILQVEGSDVTLRNIHPWGPESFYTRQVSGSGPRTFQHPNGEIIRTSSLGYTHKGITIANVEYDPALMTVTLNEFDQVVATPINPIPAETPATIRIRRDQVGVEFRGAGSNNYQYYLEVKACIWGNSHHFYDCFPRPGDQVPLDCILEAIPDATSNNDISGTVLNINSHGGVMKFAQAMRNPNVPSRSWKVHPSAWAHWRTRWSHDPVADQVSGGATVHRFYSGAATSSLIAFAGLQQDPEYCQAGVDGTDFLVNIAGTTQMKVGPDGLQLPRYTTVNLPTLGNLARRILLDFTTSRVKAWDGSRWLESPDIFLGAGGPNGAVSAHPGALYSQSDSHASNLWVKSGTGTSGWVPASRPFATAIPFRPFSTQHINNAFSGNPGASLTTAADRLDLAPMMISYTTPVTRMGIYVTTIAAGVTAKVVLYASDVDGRPAALLFESGDIALSALNYVYASLTQTLDAGRLYWVGARYSGPDAVIRAIPVASAASLGTNATDTTGYTMMRRTIAYATAAPASFAAVIGDLVSGATPPEIGFRV